MMAHASENPHPHPQLVYVRRKPDAELAAAPAPAPTPTPSTPCPPLNPILAVASFNLPKPKPSAHDHGANPTELDSLEAPAQASLISRLPWEGRISQLNNLFNKLDQSNQKGYIDMLRSLSSVELSKLAVELEKRSIQLSLDEAKELQRVQLLNVLDRYAEHSRTHN